MCSLEHTMTLASQSVSTRPPDLGSAQWFLAYMTELDLRVPNLATSASLRKDAEGYALNFVSSAGEIEQERLLRTVTRLVDVVAAYDSTHDETSDDFWQILHEKIGSILVEEKIPPHYE